MIDELTKGAGREARARLTVDSRARSSALGAYRLQRQRAANPIRAHPHGPHGVANAASPFDPLCDEGGAAKTHLVQNVVLSSIYAPMFHSVS